MTDDELWEIVLDGTKNRNPMAAACMQSHYNLIAGHAYGILKGLCLTTNGECVHKLIQMRNPWGLSKYTGPWSEHSDLWTEEWKQQADLANANQGEFWVPLNEWRTDYAEAFNTHYREDWIISSIEGNPKDFESSGQVSQWLKFDTKEDQHVIVECTQWNARLFTPGCANDYTPQQYGFLVYHSDMSQVNSSPSMGMCDGGAINMPSLKAGSYIVRVVNFNGSDGGRDQIWKLRTFGDKEQVALSNTSNPY